MAKKRVESWVVTDDFWARAEPLVPARVPIAGKTYVRKPGAGRPPKPARHGLARVAAFGPHPQLGPHEMSILEEVAATHDVPLVHRPGAGLTVQLTSRA